MDISSLAELPCDVSALIPGLLNAANLSALEIEQLESISQSRTAQQCHHRFDEAVGRFATDKFACGEIDLEKRQRAVFFDMHWSESWRKFYLENAILDRDPLLRFLAETDEPFTWRDLIGTGCLTSDERELFKLLNSHGWVDGFVLPIPRHQSHKGLVSIVCRKPIESKRDGAFLSLAAFCYFFRIRAVLTPSDFPVSPFGLTNREFECLRLVAMGLSDRRIAQRLGISQATATEYVKGAMSRLDVSTRSEAIGIATAFGAIRA